MNALTPIEEIVWASSYVRALGLVAVAIGAGYAAQWSGEDEAIRSANEAVQQLRTAMSRRKSSQ